jgi:hypothetical protein
MFGLATPNGALTGIQGTGSAAVFSVDESVPQGGAPLLRGVRSNAWFSGAAPENLRETAGNAPFPGCRAYGAASGERHS